jgi:hypothetical protein
MNFSAPSEEQVTKRLGRVVHDIRAPRHWRSRAWSNSAVKASVIHAWSVGLVGVPDGVATPELDDSEALSVDEVAVSLDVPEVADAAGRADRSRDRDAEVDESEARLAESDDADSAFVVVPDPEVAVPEDVPVRRSRSRTSTTRRAW